MGVEFNLYGLRVLSMELVLCLFIYLFFWVYVLDLLRFALGYIYIIIYPTQKSKVYRKLDELDAAHHI
jgi:hypothetical protein